MKATLSVLGLYEYDNSIFDLMVMPEGADKTVAVETICSECAELEVLYSNPILLRKLIGNWSRSHQYKWSRLWRTLSLEYNPIENYSMVETEHHEGSSSGTENSGASRTETVAGKNGGTRKTTGSDVTTVEVAAYNADTMQGANKTTEVYEQLVTDDYSSSETRGVDESGEKTNSGKEQGERTLTRSGNIGVTTSQQMIESERLVADFDFYQVVVDDFKSVFCVEVF